MTAPLHEDIELRNRYDAEVQEIGSLPPAAIELPADQALALVVLIQIGATANPALEHNPLLPSAIAAAKQIQSTSFNPESAIHEMLELGWQKPESKSREPHKLFTRVERRPQKLRKAPPYWPDNIPYHF